MKRPPVPSQRGVALLITLVALVALLIGGISLIRSFDVSAVQAGNLAFKRDLKNHAERGVEAAQRLLTSGALMEEGTRENSLLSLNYSAVRLATDAKGLPLLLTDDAAFTTASMGNDLTDTTGTGVTVRYIIDRQCTLAGAMTVANCITYAAPIDQSSDDRQQKVKGEARPVYRISVRASGPRNSQVFIQQTVVR